MFQPYVFALALVASGPLFAQARAPVSSVPRSQVVASAEREFAKIDANKDGQMSRAEIETFQGAAISKMVTANNTAAFIQLDSDKNGHLTPAEFANLNPPPKADATTLMAIDVDKDGKISLPEHRASTITKFNKLDKNSDGILTAQEVREASVFKKK